MSFEPERPAKRRKIDQNSEEPEVRPLPYMAHARILQAIFYVPGNSREFFIRDISVFGNFFTVDEHERSSRNRRGTVLQAVVSDMC